MASTNTENPNKMPPGVPYIIGNEAAERFSYYGMSSILVVFMTTYLRNGSGSLDVMSDARADEWYHNFVSAVYILPILGAFLADALLGKFWTIFSLSLVYCGGHLALALNHTQLGLKIGLFLIALGAGGIKPCVSAFVADQFTKTQEHLLTRVFSWFYFSINSGSAISTLLIPWILEKSGPALAFGIPGVLMAAATIIIWVGRPTYRNVPSVGITDYFGRFIQGDTLRALGNLLLPVPFVAMFWALWQQSLSSWILQAKKLDRHLFGHEWLPAQVQTVNPVFILLLLPLFSYVIYPALEKAVRLTPLRKIGMGLFVTTFAFWIVTWIQQRIDAGQSPPVSWQILAFLIISAGEIMVSVTHLEFAYTQAPPKFKSLAMCTYLGAVSLGNFFTARVNHYIQNPDGTVRLQGAAYFWFFTEALLITAMIFVVVSPFYRGRTYAQDGVPA